MEADVDAFLAELRALRGPLTRPELKKLRARSHKLLASTLGSSRNAELTHAVVVQFDRLAPLLRMTGWERFGAEHVPAGWIARFYDDGQLQRLEHGGVCLTLGQSLAEGKLEGSCWAEEYRRDGSLERYGGLYDHCEIASTTFGDWVRGAIIRLGEAGGIS